MRRCVAKEVVVEVNLCGVLHVGIRVVASEIFPHVSHLVVQLDSLLLGQDVEEMLVLPFVERELPYSYHVCAIQHLPDLAVHAVARDAEIVDRECRCEQEDEGEGNGNPVDAPCLGLEERDADEVEPQVEGDEVEATDGDAVVAETADDADRHEQQQWQYCHRQIAGDEVVRVLVLQLADRIKSKLNEDESHH